MPPPFYHNLRQRMVASLLRLGKTGPILTSFEGQARVRAADDLDFARLAAADATMDEEVVTRRQLLAAAPVLVFGNGSVNNAGTSFLAPGYMPAVAPANPMSFYAPRAGTLRKMYLRLRSPGTGVGDLKFTLVINGFDTALVVQMAATGQLGSDLVHSVAVTAGQTIGVSCVNVGSVDSSPADLLCSMEYALAPKQARSRLGADCLTGRFGAGWFAHTIAVRRSMLWD